MTEQTLARTRPTFFDLVIALASGVGGVYVMTRKESSAIPGVAMAVSLLPPQQTFYYQYQLASVGA